MGFDWRLPPAEGILQSHFADLGEVRFEFSGDQPENVVLLYQSVPVMPAPGIASTFAIGPWIWIALKA